MGARSNPRSRTKDIVLQDYNGEVLIYDVKTHKAFCLNETAAEVWRKCDGTRSVAEIGREIGDERVAWLALKDLQKNQLVEQSVELQDRFDGMSRRDVIKKIGIGSMIAIPVVASLIAPPAAHAASCAAACTCTINGSADIICTSPAQGSCSPGCVCRRDASGNSPAGHCAL